MIPTRPVLDHASVAVTDFARAKGMYDRVMAVLGVPYAKGMEGRSAGYGHDGHASFWITLREDADPGRGVHFAFFTAERATVDAFHAEALAAGFADNGAPGIRPKYTQPYYAAFVIDPDGNRLEAVCRAPE